MNYDFKTKSVAQFDLELAHKLNVSKVIIKNIRYGNGYKIFGQIPQKKIGITKKKVLQLDLNENIINRYESIAEAARQLNCPVNNMSLVNLNIIKVLNGNLRTNS